MNMIELTETSKNRKVLVNMDQLCFMIRDEELNRTRLIFASKILHVKETVEEVMDRANH